MSDFTLFDPSEYDKLKTPVQDDFLNTNMDLLCSFPGIVDKSFERLQKEVLSTIEVRSRNRNLPAVVVSGFMAGYLKELYPTLCREKDGRFFMRLQDHTKIYVKKLNAKFRPTWGKDTEINTLIVNQRADSDGEEKIGNVFLGYNSAEDNITAAGVYAVCIDGEEIIWRTDLRALAAGNINVPNKPLLPKNSPPSLKDGIVTIKKTGER
jgi:hypothetical protein